MAMIIDDANARGRSASPVPPPPVESTPGPRASALQNAYERALETTMNKCSYDNFASCFPTAAANVPATLMQFHQDFVTRLQGACKTEFTDIIKDREVVLSLNSLDALITDARGRREQSEGQSPPIAPHTLQPQDLLSAHMGPFLSQQEATLSSSLTNLDGRNSDLLQLLHTQGAEISNNLASLEAMIQDIERSANLVQDSEMQLLTEEIKTISQEAGV